MRTKRILAWILCIAMLMTFMPVTGLASDFSAGLSTQSGENAAATEEWLNTSGNKLYVGGIEVTPENAANITGDGITAGSAYFEVENGIPTLYLDGVTIKDGYKESDFVGGSDGYIYIIYGIYFEAASDGKLKIKLSGENVVEAEEFTDDKHKAARIYGIITDGDCTELALEGNENSSLKVTSEQNTLAIYNGSTYDDWKNCVISINGGKYEFKADNGDGYSGEAIFCRGSLKIENAKVNASSKRNRAIWINIVGGDFITGNEVTSIKNSDVAINAGTGTEWWDGILSYGDIVIENSTVDITCDENGLAADGGKSITISGADTVVSVKSLEPVDESYWEDSYAAILTKKGDYDHSIPEITLNDGLAVTTPDAGSISEYDFSGYGRYPEYRTVVDQYGKYAREVVIKAPTEHCVCGEADCTSHTGTITHIADNSLNLVPDIVSGTTLTSGSYYLSDNLTVDNSESLIINGTVNICLNGYTLDAAQFIPGENAVLNICDCKGGGKVTNPQSHVIAFQGNNGTVNIYGGAIETTDIETNAIVDLSKTDAGSSGNTYYTGNVLNLYGGTVAYSGNGTAAAIGSRTLVVNLYGGKVTAKSGDGIVVLNGKLNLLGNTEISVKTGYNSVNVYGKELIDARNYTGGNVSILCSGLSEGNVVVKNVTDATAGKFTISASDTDHILVKEGDSLVYRTFYNISFNPGGGSGTMGSVRITAGDYELPECTFTPPAEKKFRAWSVNGKEYAPGESVSISGDTSVTAVWENIVKESVRIEERPQSFEYDTFPKSFAIKANVTGGFTVTYEKDGAAIASPINAGTYDVVIKRDADATYAEYNNTIKGGLVITPKDITDKATVGAFAKMTYNGSAQTPQAVVTIDGLAVTGKWSDVTNVADTTTFTASGNFTGTIAGKSTGMKKALSGVADKPSAKIGLVYDKTAQVLTASGAANGGVMKYSIDGNNWDEKLPEGTNAGTYTVYFKVFGDENHEDTAADSLQVSIAKASVDIPTAAGKVYTGEPLTADISSNEYYTVSENNGGTATGSYDVKLALNDSANYRWKDKADDVSEVTIAFNISSAENKWTLDPAIADRTYGEAASTPSYAAKFGDVKVEYKKATEEDSAYTEEVPTNAGKYNVRLTVAATKNFSGLTKVLDFSIAKASVAIPAVPGKIYTGALQKAEISDTKDYTVSENNGGTKAGRYDVKLALKDSTNYYWDGKADDVSEITLDFRIAKSDNEWKTVPSIADWTYGETASTPSYAAKFGDVKVEYKKAADEDSAYTTAAPTDAGSYKARFSVAATDDFGDLSKVVDFSIAKADVTVTAPTAKKNLVYSGSAQALTEGGSAVGGEIQYSSSKDGTYSTEVITATNAGSYEVWYKVTGDSNHNDAAPAKIDVLIAKASVAIPTVSGKIYTGALQKAEISDTKDYTVSENNGGTKAGRYDVKLALKDSTNYYWDGKADDVSEITLDFRIAKSDNEWKTVPSIADWTYGGTASTPSYAAKFGDVKVEYKKAADEDSAYTTAAPTDAGNYKARFSVTATDDFGDLSKVVDFSIAKADVTVTAPTAKKNLVYSGSAQALTEGGSAVGGEIQYSSSKDGTYSTEVITATNAGSYEVWYKVTGDSNHNDAAPVKIDVSIAKAAQSAPASAEAVKETIKGKSDGKITGVDSAMEYKADGASGYTAVTGNEIANLAAGTYKVRYKETDNYLAGDDKTIEIAAGEMITVTFESNGGTAVDAKTCEYNMTVSEPEIAPTKDGYEFIGWFADSGLTTEWNFGTDKFTENKTLYAKWVRGTVSEGEGSVENVTAEGINDVAKSEKTDISLIVKVQEAAESNEGQTAIKNIADAPRHFGFYEISLEKSTGGMITEASSVIEIKIPYDFTKKRNIRVYRYHGGNAQELTALAERAAVKPFVDGKCFVDTENGCIYIYSSKFSTYSVAYDNVSSGSGSSSTSGYTVRFETNGGSSVSTQTVSKNAVAKEPDEPKKDGYTFDGWYLSNDFSEKYDFAARVTKNLTLYAKWTEDKEPTEDENNKPNDTDKHDCPSKDFKDLDINLWYHLDTDYVLSGGLMKGTSAKIFEPNKNLTRAMLVTILYRNEGEPSVGKNNTFTDVEKNSYYENAVSWAQQNGIVKGISETKFAPNASITREQIAAMMHRYAKFKGIDVSSEESTNIQSYKDVSTVSDFAAAPMRWAVGSGLIKGRSETTLNPKGNATRAEIAAILHRFLTGNK